MSCMLSPCSGTDMDIWSQHLLRYPVINDSVTTFKQNEYGQRSIRLGDSAYKTFAAPIVSVLKTPYQYVSPYVKRADDIGDQTLSKVDERFPVVRKPTGELYAGAKGIVLLPYQKGVEGKEQVLSLYTAEHNKVGGDGLISHAKTVVSTILIVGGETLGWVLGTLNAKKEEAKEKYDEKAHN